MKTVEFTFKFPTHLIACYVNSDESGLDDNESEILNQIDCEALQLEKQYNGVSHSWEFSEESDFEFYPDFGVLPCDCSKATLTIFLS